MVADVQVEGLLPNEQRAALVFNALQKFLFLGCAFTSLCNLQHLWHPSWIQSKVATFHLLLFWLRGALAVNCKVLQTMSRKTMKVPKRFQVPTIPRPTEPLSPPVVAIGVVTCCDSCHFKDAGRLDSLLRLVRSSGQQPARCNIFATLLADEEKHVIIIHYLHLLHTVWRNMEKYGEVESRSVQISSDIDI